MIVKPSDVINRSPINGAKILKVNVTQETRKIGSQELQSDYYLYRIQAQVMGDPNDVRVLDLWVPIDHDGVYEIEGVWKVPIMDGVATEQYRMEPGLARNIYVRRPSEVIGDMLEEAIGIGLGVQQNPKWAQDKVDMWFKTSPLLMQVEPMKAADMELARETIRLDIVHKNHRLDYQERILRPRSEGGDYPGLLDPLTTPSGSKAGIVYRICNGVQIENRRLRMPPSQSSVFSKTMRACLLFPSNTRSNRLQIMRSNFGRHESLPKAEIPLVAHVSYDNQLSGVHLVTAVTPWDNNYADAITISKSAADKLRCWRDRTVVVKDSQPIMSNLMVGDILQPDAVLAQTEGGKVISGTGLAAPAKVARIDMIPTRVSGQEAWKLRILLIAEYPLETGDKIITRHGGKGVVVVTPDEEMPLTDEGVRVECIVHPRSIYARRAMGTLREMMMNRKIQTEGLGPVRVGHFNQQYSMEYLHDQRYGARCTLTVDGQSLPTKTFVAPLFWMRCDKHAREALSSTGADKPVNQHGRNPNSGKVSGQRLNIGMGTVLEAKGMKTLYQTMVRENVEPGALKLMQRALQCVE